MEINYNKKQWKFQFLSCSSHISVAQEPPVARGCRIGRPKKFLWTALREHTRFCLLTVDFWVPGTSGWITGHPSASFKAWIIILRVSRPVRGGRSVPYCPLQLPACGTRAGVTDITRATPGTAEELTHPSWLAPLPPRPRFLCVGYSPSPTWILKTWTRSQWTHSTVFQQLPWTFSSSMAQVGLIAVLSYSI